MASNDQAGIAFAQPRTFSERRDAAVKCCKALKMTIPLVVDDLDDRIGRAYSGAPDRLYLIGTDGRVKYKGGRGPFGFKVGELEQTLLLHLLDLGEVEKRPRSPARTRR